MKRLTYIAIVILAATACNKQILQPVQPPRVITDTSTVQRFRIIDSLPVNLDSVFKHHVRTLKSTDTLILKHPK